MDSRVSSVKIAIAGGGIMGLVTAYRLACAGATVTVFDGRGFPADNASFMAGGMLAPYAEIDHLDADWIDAGLGGISFWKKFSQGHDIGFMQGGSLLLSHVEDRYMLERFRAHLPSYEGIDFTADVAALEPELTGRFSGGIYLAQEAQLHPEKTMRALIGVLQETGVEFVRRNVNVREMAQTYDFVIDARGMDAESDMDLRAVKGEVVIVRNKDLDLSRSVRLMHPRYPLYIVPRGGGIYMIGATQVEAQGEGVSVRSAMELMSALYSLHPSFGDAEIVQMKSGLRPAYPDNLPKIVVRGNVVVANGLFRHGYLLSPIMAEIICARIFGERAVFDELFLKGSCDDEIDYKRAGAAF